MTVEYIVNNMSSFEFRGWTKYYEYVATEHERAMNKAKASRGRR